MLMPTTLTELIAYEIFAHETGLKHEALVVAWMAKPIPKAKPLYSPGAPSAEYICKQSFREVNEMRAMRGRPPLIGDGWDVCRLCGHPTIIGDLRDKASVQEFQISGSCMKCQDQLFPSFKPNPQRG